MYFRHLAPRAPGERTVNEKMPSSLLLIIILKVFQHLFVGLKYIHKGLWTKR